MYLGLDLGTTGLKALLIGDDQAVIASATSTISVSRPHTGWAEQDPGDWIDAAQDTIRNLSSQADLSGVRGIGLSGHMHGATVLDADDNVIRPCILWNDTRSFKEATELNADPEFQAISGNIVFPGFTAPKLVWLQRNEPENFQKIRRVLLPKDFLRLWLTGEAVSEMSDAAGTSWLDTGARKWSEALVSKTGLDQSTMPRLVEGSEVSGRLRANVASLLGLTDGVPVAGGAGDNAASAIGMGVISPGQAFVSLGTSGVLFASNESYRPAPETAVHTFCHAIPDTWHQMGVILSATDALNWYGRFVGRSAEELTSALGELERPSRTTFLPYLGGERTPLNNASIRGAFTGLEHATEQASGTRAVLEGVAFALRDCREALASTGTSINRLLAVGGGAQSEYWLRVIATTLNCEIDLPESAELGAAFGAARLGMMCAAGETRSIATPPTVARTIAPEAGLTSAFDEGFARYVAARTSIGAI